MALEKRMTIFELFMTTIKNSYMELQKLGYYCNHDHEICNDKMFEKLIRGEVKGFFNTIIKFNWKHIEGTDFERHIIGLQNKASGSEVIKVKKGDEIVE